MHHLHPRSRTTSTLFTTTLAISFLVVALPHLLPCPVDRRQFADTIEMPDGTIKRRRRQRQTLGSAEHDQSDQVAGDAATDHLVAMDRPKRECPVPKPGGLVGQMMGFDGKRTKEEPVEVVVQSLRASKRSQKEERSKVEPELP